MLKIGSPVGSLDKNALETEITQLKDNITSLRIQNDGYKIKIANHTRRYIELSKASTHSHNTSNEKIAALNAEIAKMKPSGSGTKVSGPKTPEKPKVLAPGMYAISSKYITHLDKEIGLHQLLGRSMSRLTPAAEVSKPQFTRENQKSRVLPTKNESARRVEDHPRNLNKRNNVARPKTIPKNVRKTDITVAYRIVPQWKATG
nr:hypothetical protein [Tanacetum cinerariifolium]